MTTFESTLNPPVFSSISLIAYIALITTFGSGSFTKLCNFSVKLVALNSFHEFLYILIHPMIAVLRTYESKSSNPSAIAP